MLLQCPSGESKSTVLVVDDDDGVRNLIKQILSKRALKVLTASSGREALDLWSAHKDSISLVVTDLVVPGGLWGENLARIIRLDNPDVRIIYLSGHTKQTLDSATLQLDPKTNFLQKPFRHSELLELVGEIVRSSASPSHVTPY